MITMCSGATAVVTKNIVDAQNVSTMPDEGLKVNVTKIYSNVIIYLKIYVLEESSKRISVSFSLKV